MSKSFDQKMAAYFGELRHQAISRRGLIKAATAAGAATVAASMTGSADAARKPFLPGLGILRQDATSLVFGLEGDVRGLEPALSYDFTANPVVCQITEGLMMFDANGALQPLLAESFEQPDALTYIYKLRAGVTFHDGSPMTADDVVASIARVRDPEVAGPMAWMYDNPGATVEKVDDMTVKITLATPSALFQYVCATTAGHVIPAKAIADGVEIDRNPIGTGPFSFVKWDAGSEIELAKNPNYWQPGMPHFDKLIYKIVPEGTTRVAGMKTGDLHAVTAVPPDQVEEMKSFENVAWQEVVGYTINCNTFRTDKAPFDDVKVRQAVAMAIPYDDIMANIVKDTGVRAVQSTVPSNMPGSAEDQLTLMPYDVEAAKALLAESSQAAGFSTQLHVIAPNDVWIPVAVAVQQALAELNIQVEINQLAYADMITLQQSGEYEGMMNFQWGSDFPDAAGMLQPLFASENFPPNNNHAYYKNDTVDQLMKAQDSELDPEKRKQMLIDIQKQIAADVPMIFFEHFKWYMPMSKDVTGYTVTALWYWDCFGRTLMPASM